MYIVHQYHLYLKFHFCRQNLVQSDFCAPPDLQRFVHIFFSTPLSLTTLPDTSMNNIAYIFIRFSQILLPIYHLFLCT